MKAISDWANRCGVTLFRERDKSRLVGFYISHGAETFQVVLEVADTVRVDVWSIETKNDQEIHVTYFVPKEEIVPALNKVVSAIRLWFSNSVRFPASLAG